MDGRTASLTVATATAAAAPRRRPGASTSCGASTRRRSRRRCPRCSATTRRSTCCRPRRPRSSWPPGGSWSRCGSRARPSRAWCGDRELQAAPCGQRLGAGLGQRLRARVAAQQASQGVAVTREAVTVGGQRRRPARASRWCWWRAIPDNTERAVAWSPPTRWPPSRDSRGSCPTTASTATWPSAARPRTTSLKGAWAPTGSPLVRALADRPMADLRLPRRDARWPSCRRPSTGRAWARPWRGSPTRHGRDAASARPGSRPPPTGSRGRCGLPASSLAASDGFRQRFDVEGWPAGARDAPGQPPGRHRGQRSVPGRPGAGAGPPRPPRPRLAGRAGRQRGPDPPRRRRQRLGCRGPARAGASLAGAAAGAPRRSSSR